ncbi:hypothetical protein [Candidatus Phytoplasma sp. AldY-WA1]|uniref:hypothetical protein n=1 Tax=Candidatus Phytoplasma sp. AldY-WA1 TaxID=2852100 RepID=UPI0025509206|nr:hypothetical protein [Candidatus Phytoplasma sp. AldY-WA1]
MKKKKKRYQEDLETFKIKKQTQQLINNGIIKEEAKEYIELAAHRHVAYLY